MTLTPNEILEAWGGKLGGRIEPDKCVARHFPRTPCPSCGNTPPRGALTQVPTEPRILQWQFWYGGATYTTGTESRPTPEHAEEMEAATAAYNEAKAEHDRAGQAFLAAHIAERKAKRIMWTTSGPIAEGGPEFISRARDATIALDAAEKAMADRLRELNEVCVPPERRRARKLAAAESVRRMIFG